MSLSQAVYAAFLMGILMLVSFDVSRANAGVQTNQVEVREIPHTRSHPGVENAPFPYAHADDVGLDTERLEILADTTAAWVAQDRIVGAEILIVKDRKIVLHEAIGWSNRETRQPLQRNSIYRLRSMTKPFTGTAALLLVQEGQLELDAPVARYLPAWRNERSGAITIEQLLTHTSGFVQGGTPERASTYSSLREVVDACGLQGPQHRPGDGFMYSDVNSYTLGALVEVIADMPLGRFIKRRILEPLHLQDTHIGYAPDVDWAPRMNPTYERNDDGDWVPYWTPAASEVFPYFRASGGMLSTVFDYARWLDIWANGTGVPGRDGFDDARLLSAELVDRALISHGGDEIGDYGYHWEIHEEVPLIFGHGGSDGTLGVAVPSKDLLLLYFTQSRRSGTTMEWLEAALKATAVN